MQHQKMAQVESAAPAEAEAPGAEKTRPNFHLTESDLKAIDEVIKKNHVSADVLKDTSGRDFSLTEKPVDFTFSPSSYRALDGRKPLDLSLPSMQNRGPLYDYGPRDLKAPPGPDDLRIVIDRALTYDLRWGDTPLEMTLNPRKCGLRTSTGICFRTKIQ